MENTDAFIVASKKSGLEVMADKAKYMILSRDQNGGLNLHIKIHNKFLWKVGTLNVWEQTKRIKILFRKTLRADLS
jgi:hypothetical protein